METPPPLPPPQTPRRKQLPTRQGMGCFRGRLSYRYRADCVCYRGRRDWRLVFYGKAVTIFTSPQPIDVRIENVSDVDLRKRRKRS